MDKLLEQISWDYNLSVDDARALVEGKSDRAGHYTRQAFFKKLLESYPWFSVLKILPATEIKKLLTSEVINSLRSPSLKQKYEFISRRLNEVI
ncbi:MAG: hypothetical protein U5Q03_13755 [Bacteroidota bacterium]|nr:hypothetical protein [Bacteroidota bacterium]